MILLLDIGNTSTKIATYKVGTNRISNYKSFLTCRKKTILKILIYNKTKNIKYALISSVVPSIYKIIKNSLIKNKVKVYELKDKKINKQIRINVKKKIQVGSDRIANAIGALNYYKNSSRQRFNII